MMRFIRTTMLGFALAALPAQSLETQATEPDDAHRSDLLVRFNGPVNVAQADTLTSVWVFNNEARIDGTLRDHIVVVSGTARIDGAVKGAVVVINGHLELGPGARIDDNVLLYGSTMNRVPGAVVLGSIHQESGMSFSARAAWFLWFTTTLAVLVAAMAVMWLSGSAIAAATDTLSSDKGFSVLTAGLLLLGLPAAAVASVITGVGFGVGVFIAFFAIPVLAFAGYVVIGHTLGRAVLGSRWSGRERPYLAVTAGVLMLQVVTIIPIVGGLIVFVAAPVGAGALIFHVWTIRRGDHAMPAAVMQPA